MENKIVLVGLISLLSGCGMPDNDLKDAVNKIKNQIDPDKVLKVTSLNRCETPFGYNAYCNELSLVNVGDNPILIKRVIVNNKPNPECTKEPTTSDKLKTGDSLNLPFTHQCGEKIVKVNVQTDQGSFEFMFN